MTDPTSVTVLPVEGSWEGAESPLPHGESRRRHRRVTLPASVVLVICIFLPTLRVCGHPTAAIEWPMFWTPYIVGAFVFAATLTRPWRLGWIAVALRVVLGLTAAGWGLPWLGAMLERPEPEMLLVYPALVLVIATITIPARTAEAMVARCGLVTAIGSTIWFGLISADHDAMFGAYLSFGAAALLAVGCTCWWFEAVSASPRSRPARSIRRASA